MYTFYCIDTFILTDMAINWDDTILAHRALWVHFDKMNSMSMPAHRNEKGSSKSISVTVSNGQPTTVSAPNNNSPPYSLQVVALSIL